MKNKFSYKSFITKHILFYFMSCRRSGNRRINMCFGMFFCFNPPLLVFIVQGYYFYGYLKTAFSFMCF